MATTSEVKDGTERSAAAPKAGAMADPSAVAREREGGKETKEQKREKAKASKPTGPLFYSVRATFTEAMLGSSPASSEVYQRFIGERLREEREKLGEEVETLPASDKDKAGRSVYHKDEKGIFLFDYKIRGFLKSAAQAITGREEISNYKSKIDMWVFTAPRRIYLHAAEPANHILQEPDGVLERPIRAMTMQGPRVSLKASEIVKEGTWIDFEICVLPLGQKEFTEEILTSWLHYGAWQGLGEWRNGSYGRFEFQFAARS